MLNRGPFQQTAKVRKGRRPQLISVFGRVLREGWIDEKDIEGLNEEKRHAIHQIASL